MSYPYVQPQHAPYAGQQPYGQQPSYGQQPQQPYQQPYAGPAFQQNFTGPQAYAGPPAYPGQPPQYGGQQYYAPQHAQPHYPMPPSVVVQVAPMPSIGEQKYLEGAEKSVRMAFIRKVYGILSLQLSVTLALVLAFSYSTALRSFVLGNPAILWTSMILTFVFLFALSCFPSVARNYPTNYLCLAGFTLCQSVLVGSIASTYSPDIVVKAVVATGVLTLGLTLFAFQTRIDFTAMSGSMFCLLLVLLLFGVWTSIFPSQVAATAYAALGALVFSLFIVYDTQLIIGGKHSHQFSIDEAVFAALTLYIDIIQLFMFMLRLFGNRD